MTGPELKGRFTIEGFLAGWITLTLVIYLLLWLGEAST